MFDPRSNGVNPWTEELIMAKKKAAKKAAKKVAKKPAKKKACKKC
jgi:hypothetical protein